MNQPTEKQLTWRKKERQRSIDEYHKNPTKCKACGKIIEVQDQQSVSQVRKKIVCNHACATNLRWQDKENQLTDHNKNFGKFANKGAQARNKTAHERAVERYRGVDPTCLQCGNKINLEEKSYWMSIAVAAKRKFCSFSCVRNYHWQNNRATMLKRNKAFEGSDITLLQLKTKNSGWRTSIARNARLIFNNSDRPKACAHCPRIGHVQIAHKKAVSSFPDTALICEINHIDNLLPLCPNCHDDFDSNVKL